MYAFDYHRPRSLAEASDLASGDGAKLLAGGQTLLPTMKQRLAAPEALVDLALLGLDGISANGDLVTIGAMARHADVAAAAEIVTRFPALAELAGMIGDPAVRNRGTIGGSIANNDPAADYPAACLAADATIVTDRRRLAATEFFTGLFSTALDEGEIVTAVEFPVPDIAGFEKLRNPASRYATAAVFLARRNRSVRVAVTGAGADGVFRCAPLEAALEADFSAAALDGVVLPPDGLSEDLHASAEYRANLIVVLTRRIVRRLAAGADALPG
jgi:carbon-monoxide dehydrogenase medium subunit